MGTKVGAGALGDYENQPKFTSARVLLAIIQKDIVG